MGVEGVEGVAEERARATAQGADQVPSTGLRETTTPGCGARTILR
jgi:hypothetical protein